MGVRSLTRAEAERRAGLLAVDRYDVAVDLTELPSCRCRRRLGQPAAGLGVTRAAGQEQCFGGQVAARGDPDVVRHSGAPATIPVVGPSEW